MPAEKGSQVARDRRIGDKGKAKLLQPRAGRTRRLLRKVAAREKPLERQSVDRRPVQFAGEGAADDLPAAPHHGHFLGWRWIGAEHLLLDAPAGQYEVT